MTAWEFAAALWARPGVQALCLELQDAHGQCLPLLLWRLWTLDERRCPSPVCLAEAVDAARAWETGVIGPARLARGRLKSPLPLVDTEARLALRDLMRAAELAAERALLDGLERLAPPPGAVAEPPLAAMIALAELWRAPAPIDLLARLVAAL